MQTVVIGSLEKLMGDGEPRPASLIGGLHASGFLGERLSLQIAVRLDEPADAASAGAGGSGTAGIEVELVGDLSAATRVSAVRRVPVSAPAPENADEHYLVTEPGEYPDVLEPVTTATVDLTPGRWEALWIDVLVEDAELAGAHELTVRLRPVDDDSNDSGAQHTLRLQIHPHQLPPLEIVNTHWFHADSLSSYYGVEVFSERHWELIEAFLRSAREMDVNSVLTPTWTPPLDASAGHRRGPQAPHRATGGHQRGER